MRKHGIRGYLTIFLTLLLAILVAFCLTLLKGVRQNGIRLETEIAFDVALNSIMAQYHRELQNRYNLFAIDTSYGTDNGGIWKTEEKLSYFFEGNLPGSASKRTIFHKDFFGIEANELAITGAAFLTDENGKIFRILATKAIQSDVGASYLEKLEDWTRTVQEYDLENINLDKRREETAAQIEAVRQSREVKEKKVPVESPVQETESAVRVGLLSLVDSLGNISGKAVRTDTLWENRKREGLGNEGNMEPDETKHILDKAAFYMYLSEYFGSYDKKPSEEGVLDYELEYILCGKDSDWENLNDVLSRIYALREGANFLYLSSDRKKNLEAEAVAAVAATAILHPELTEPFKWSILFAWTSVESLYDVRALYQGKKVPLIKDSKSWHTDLAGILGGILEKNAAGGGQGLDYGDYLKVLLGCSSDNETTIHAMNLIEANIRMTPGNASFRLDNCVTQLEAEAGIISRYGYVNTISRRRKYE